MDKVNTFIKKNQLLHKNATVMVGVSGGPDSMALLHYMNPIKQEWSLRLIAVSVDHGLRGEQSKQDVIYVKDICDKWGIEFFETFVDVKSYKELEGKGTQVAARDLRYRFFEEQMNIHQADYLALGHHGDDQAETMVMRLIRGANPASLTGIPIKRKLKKGYLIRPLLCITKDRIMAYCKENHIVPREDPSNKEDSYTRNYFRIHILPLLKKQNPSLHKNLQRLSEVVSHDERYLNQQAKELVKQVVTYEQSEKGVSFRLSDFEHYPIALQRRAFHLILDYLYHTIPSGLNYVHEDQFIELIHSERANVTVDLPMGLKMSKAYDKFWFHFRSFSQKSTEIIGYLDAPGSLLLPDGSKITAKLTSHLEQNSKYMMSCPVNAANTLPFMVRYRRDGDKMQVKGLNGSKKVKDIFIDEKIPLHLRDTWPIVVDHNGNIVWLVGLKKGIVTESDLATHSFLQLHYIKGNM